MTTWDKHKIQMALDFMKNISSIPKSNPYYWIHIGNFLTGNGKHYPFLQNGIKQFNHYSKFMTNVMESDI